MSAPKRKLTSLNIDQKIEILDALQSKTKTRSEVSADYGIGMSTIFRIVQQEEKIRGVALDNGNTARKRLRKGNHDELDQAVRVWFRQMRAKDTFVNGPMIQQVAKQFAQKLNIPNFKSSNGWLARWKAKENVTFQKLKRDNNKSAGATDNSGADDWIQKVLPRFLSQYDAKDIYAVAESGLLYKALPGEPMATDGEKMQKDRMTTLFLCNMEGSDKHVFVVGTSSRKHSAVPLPYFSNPKAWMTSSVWTNILMDLDSKMAEQKRKVLIFANNAACHRLEDGAVMRNVRVQFLPANTKSIVQQIYRGIIRAFKVHYRQKIVLKQMLALEQGLSEQQFAKTITMPEAMKLVEECWNLVTPKTIRNCYGKAGFPKTGTEEDPGSEEDEVIQLQIPDYNFNDYIECDANLDCYGELNPDDIVQEVLQQKSDREEEEEKDDDQGTRETQQTMPCPSYEDALTALTVLRAYFEHKNGP